MNHFSIVQFLGALCFFLYGLHMAEEGLRRSLGDRLRTQVDRLTRNRLVAFALGAVMTIVFQSSTATVVMLVGMASLGVLSVRRAIPVVLGADVGTTLLVLVLASLVRFDIRIISLGILVMGFAATFLFRTNRPRFYAETLLGFGFVFFGLSLLSTANEPLRESALVRSVIAAIVSNPAVAIFFAALFTGLIQSSAAVLGILLSFASAGLITATEAVPFVLGANLGSTIGPFVASLRAQADGKRVAYVHMAIKVIGILAILPFAQEFANWIVLLVDAPSYQVAAIHILFNIILAILFMPFLGLLSSLATSLVKQDENDKEFGAKYLDPSALDSPALAFANVFREVLRLAEIAQEMCSQVLIPFEEVSRETMERLEELDDQVDHLDRDIKYYLAKINQAALTDEQGRRELELMMLTHDLESIGDVINKDLMELAEKKRHKNVSFSQEGWKEIQEFHRVVMENFRLAITALASGDVELGKKVLRYKKHLNVMEQELGQKHLLRLHQGLRESFETSSIHLDLLSNLRRIHSIVCKMVYSVVDRRHPSSGEPDAL